MRILVCGGAGYIGSNMTAMLAAEGHRPVVFDNLSTGHRSAVPSTYLKDKERQSRCGEFVQGDLADYELLIKTLKKYEVEAVMHFAALIEVGESVHYPLKYYHNNLCGTQTLLSAMEAAGVEKFVFSSSAAVYGEPRTYLKNKASRCGVTEESPTEPINPYGETKLAAERMCYYQSQTGKLRYATLRYFNVGGAGVYGPAPKRRTASGGQPLEKIRPNQGRFWCGEDHRPESHLIPLTIGAAMGKRSEIPIYGTDYPTPDGTCIRDYIHIEDLCRAHLLALNKLETESELIYNLGNGKGYSVKEVIETVKKVSGKDFKVAAAERRPGDAPILTSDATKAKNELGWKPELPELEKIVSTAWQWHNEHPDGYPD